MELVCLSNIRCCSVFMRIFVILVNILKTILGLLFVILGVHMIRHWGSLKTLWGVGGPLAMIIFLLLLGLFLILLGVSGVVGACLPIYNWGLVLHIWLLCVLLAVELVFAIGLLCYADSNKLSETVTNSTTAAYSKYGGAGIKVAATMAIDSMQLGLKCCGNTASSDFASSSVCPTWVTKNTQTYPDSCCSTFSASCGNTTDTSKLHSSGCQTKITSLFKSWFVIIGLVLCGFWVFQLIGLIFSFLLINKHTNCYCCACLPSYGTRMTPVAVQLESLSSESSAA